MTVRSYSSLRDFVWSVGAWSAEDESRLSPHQVLPLPVRSTGHVCVGFAWLVVVAVLNLGSSKSQFVVDAPAFGGCSVDILLKLLQFSESDNIEAWHCLCNRCVAPGFPLRWPTNRLFIMAAHELDRKWVRARQGHCHGQNLPPALHNCLFLIYR